MSAVTSAPKQHQLREDEPFEVNIVDHPSRGGDSRWFRAAKQAAKKILATLDDSTYPYPQPHAPKSWEMHHGGSLWVLTDGGWVMYRARVPIEWCMQFCADPGKIDRLRREAKTLVDAFPKTIPALEKLGYRDAEAILNEEITDADGIERYTDSLFNSCVPLSYEDHQARLPKAAGEHHYPIPIKGADFFRHDDFVLWVTNPEDGTNAAVVPVARRGRGDWRVQLVHARHGTRAGDALDTAVAEDKALILPPDHPLAVEAFQHQS